MCVCVCDTGVLVIRLGDVVVMMRVGDEFIWKSAFFFHPLVSANLQRFTFEVSFRVHSRLELLQWIVPVVADTALEPLSN